MLRAHCLCVCVFLHKDEVIVIHDMHFHMHLGCSGGYGLLTAVVVGGGCILTSQWDLLGICAEVMHCIFLLILFFSRSLRVIVCHRDQKNKNQRHNGIDLGKESNMKFVHVAPFGKSIIVLGWLLGEWVGLLGWVRRQATRAPSQTLVSLVDRYMAR